MTQHELLTEALFRLRAIQSHATKQNIDPTMREIARLATEGQDRVERALRVRGEERPPVLVNNDIGMPAIDRAFTTDEEGR